MSHQTEQFRLTIGSHRYEASKLNVIILLLCGGDKSSQPQDITIAKQYWNEYQERP
jgi:putative component of toxin-antitoxin plasmid stabilization module